MAMRLFPTSKVLTKVQIISARSKVTGHGIKEQVFFLSAVIRNLRSNLSAGLLAVRS
jgi:hypothetical protein